jgi:hypothetical protein
VYAFRKGRGYSHHHGANLIHTVTVGIRKKKILIRTVMREMINREINAYWHRHGIICLLARGGVDIDLIHTVALMVPSV